MTFMETDRWPVDDGAVYRQCLLRRGEAEQVAWIPTTFAVVGKTLRLLCGGGWGDGFRVVEVYPAEQDALSTYLGKEEHEAWRAAKERRAGSPPPTLYSRGSVLME